ncbi:MAG: thiamine pyrophosphate-dependent enzyme [Chloroflexota bacterium]
MLNHLTDGQRFHDHESDQILSDYRLATRSREMSIACRREVLNGRAKFGASGDGKELAQLALARVFQNGDWRSGYYRDQTLMLALDLLSVQSFFAQLYAHADLQADPASGGRMMVSHFASRSLDERGEWVDQTVQANSAPDSSPTASQMPRLVGLAQASKLYRQLEDLPFADHFSINGDEIAFGMIGNASTAEGMFWESLNAIGILEVPAIVSIWDDGYGISVPNKHQILKEDLSQLLVGFQRTKHESGFDLYTVRGWDYPALLEAYEEAALNAREAHQPAIIHVIEMTQPLGHSTSGSHERYKSEARLAWETAHDPLKKMRAWIIDEGIADGDLLDEIEREEVRFVRHAQKAAWIAFVESIDRDRQAVAELITKIAQATDRFHQLNEIKEGMYSNKFPRRKDLLEASHKVLFATRDLNLPQRDGLIEWKNSHKSSYQTLYSDQLHDELALTVTDEPARYGPDAEEVPAFQLLNRYFDQLFEADPRVVTFGEDVGFLGGVNQSMSGMQAKYGELRVADTGIRETTIMGQALGLAMRGFRPIAEIQYLDYILYALQIMSDDLATLRWRTRGGQTAPVIVRTRGHRLEGVWHSGSPMGGILNLIRGMHVLVPRDMTRAAAFYNTLLQGDDPALVVEPLNGYRKKETLPENLSTMQLPLGKVETLRTGDDLTLVTYGPLCYIALEAAERLSEAGIEVEVFDVQSLLPFDLNGAIGKSLQKTSRLLVVDEDVPGGASAFILQQIMERQNGYHWLDSQPRTLTAQPHRAAYGADGNYFSKPNAESIFETIYEVMHEADPASYPMFY